MLEKTLHDDVTATLEVLKAGHPGLEEELGDAYGYAVFPTVGRASVVLGGTYGKGEVYEQGNPIGAAKMAAMTIGVQLGGQTFTELLVFPNKDALDRFKRGEVTFTANASAVMVKAGASGTTDPGPIVARAYSQGGMLLEASLGGQRFRFQPYDGGEAGSSSRSDEEQEGGGGGDGQEGGGGSVRQKLTSAVSKVGRRISESRKQSPEPLRRAGSVLAGLTTEQSMRKTLHPEVRAALKRQLERLPDLRETLQKAYGFAVFPSVGRASVVLGGSYGRGEVYEHARLVGYAAIAQLTIGLQLGGTTFSELAVIEDEEAMKRFTSGEVGFAANASATVMKAGVAATNKYKGITVYVFSEGGFQLEAALGGQKFIYRSAALTRGTSLEDVIWPQQEQPAPSA
jgi:lipid-binding SYLF domain-containing protein